MNPGLVEEGSHVARTALEKMASVPLAIALLFVNLGFLGFVAYLLGEISANAKERDKTQMELIETMVKDIRDCRQAPTRGGKLEHLIPPSNVAGSSPPTPNSHLPETGGR